MERHDAGRLPPWAAGVAYRRPMASEAVSAAPDRPGLWPRGRAHTWRLLTATIGACFRYRVTGLAAEAAFFAILSMPPLVLGLAGTIGYIVDRYSVTRVEAFEQQVLQLAGQVFTPETVDTVIGPTLSDALTGGRFDVISIGFVLALWSGSRALNVFIDTITIMYGLGGRRGIVKTRALSFVLYIAALIIGVVVIPLLLVGPGAVESLLPPRLDFLLGLYWPTVLLLSVAFLTSLYHVSVPVRTSWLYDVPGAVFTLLAWIAGSFALRWILLNFVGDESLSIYGPLSAPIAILIWLYVLSIAVLIGAALNASFDRVFPATSTAGARLELVRRLRERSVQLRMRDGGLTSAEIESVADPGAEVVDQELEDRVQRIIEDARRRRDAG
jgi:membrane protein